MEEGHACQVASTSSSGEGPEVIAFVLLSTSITRAEPEANRAPPFSAVPGAGTTQATPSLLFITLTLKWTSLLDNPLKFVCTSR